MNKIHTKRDGLGVCYENIIWPFPPINECKIIPIIVRPRTGCEHNPSSIYPFGLIGYMDNLVIGSGVGKIFDCAKYYEQMGIPQL